MPAYLVFIKEREHDSAAMADYAPKAGASLQGHAGTPLAYYGAIETLEGAEAKGAVIVAFPTMDEARAWYQSDAYLDARKSRFAGADYRVLLVDGMG